MRSALSALTVALLASSAAQGGPRTPNPEYAPGKSVVSRVCYTTEWFHGNVPVLLRHYGNNVIRVSRRSYGNV